MKNIKQLKFDDYRVEFKTTVNKKLIKKIYWFEGSGCRICPPKRGCNRRNRRNLKNWKNYRKTQYRIK